MPPPRPHRLGSAAPAAPAASPEEAPPPPAPRPRSKCRRSAGSRAPPHRAAPSPARRRKARAGATAPPLAGRARARRRLGGRRGGLGPGKPGGAPAASPPRGRPGEGGGLGASWPPGGCRWRTPGRRREPGSASRRRPGVTLVSAWGAKGGGRGGTREAPAGPGPGRVAAAPRPGGSRRGSPGESCRKARTLGVRSGENVLGGKPYVGSCSGKPHRPPSLYRPSRAAGQFSALFGSVPSFARSEPSLSSGCA